MLEQERRDRELALRLAQEDQSQVEDISPAARYLTLKNENTREIELFLLTDIISQIDKISAGLCSFIIRHRSIELHLNYTGN